MKAILISDINIPNYNLNDVFVNTSDLTLANTLEKLCHIEADVIIILAELIFKDGIRNDHHGIELLKHIRFTPELHNLNKKPIILLHWMDIEYYMERDKGNFFLFSPGIYRKRLPIKRICLDNLEPIKDAVLLNEYIVNSEEDEQKSEHLFRNRLAIEQFEKQYNTGSAMVIDKPLWFKKLYYKHGYFFKTTDAKKVQSTQSYKILLIDDLGDEWKPALLKVLPNSQITVCKSIEDAKNTISDIHKSIIGKRLTFRDNAKKLSLINEEYQEKSDSQKEFLKLNQNEKTRLINEKKNLLNFENALKDLKKQLNDLVSDLSRTDGFFEVLIDLKFENLNSDSKSKANKLSVLIAEISSLKDKIKNCNEVIIGAEKKLEDNTKKERFIIEELKNINLDYKSLSSQTCDLFESLINNEYDFVLLDMHLTKESEEKEYNEMDGFQILQDIQNAKIKLPAAIFSATRKNTEKLKDTFRFLYKNQFIKGISPLQSFIMMTERLKTDSQANRLINIIDEVIDYPSYKGRFYKYAESSVYESINLVGDKRNRIVSELRTAKESLTEYKNNGNKKHLENACKNLGIIKESRLNKRDINDQSVYVHVNAQKNRIGSQEIELHNMRNDINHNSSDSEQVSRYKQWFDKLDLDVFEKHLKVTYNKLIFDL